MIKNMISFVPIQVLGSRDGWFIPVVIVSQHLHDSTGVRKWQWTEQYRVHHAEDCRCRADAEREGQHGNDGEARTLPQPPPPIAQMLAKKTPIVWFRELKIPKTLAGCDESV